MDGSHRGTKNERRNKKDVQKVGVRGAPQGSDGGFT